MHRARALFVILVLSLLLAGCGAVVSTPASVPRAARAQRATLGWVESFGSPKSRLVFRVRSFTVTTGGWSADLSVTNDTPASFSIDDLNDVPNQTLGLMVFRTGSHAELEQRNAQSALPVLRGAASFSPGLPALLAPQATWAGTARAAGALPAGFWVRFVFGVLVPKGKMPDGLSSKGVGDVVVWITDHAHRLR